MRARGKPVAIASVKPSRPAEVAYRPSDPVDHPDAFMSYFYARLEQKENNESRGRVPAPFRVKRRCQAWVPVGALCCQTIQSGDLRSIEARHHRFCKVTGTLIDQHRFAPTRGAAPALP